MASDSGYVDYVAVLGLDPEFKPADVRRIYRKKIKDLLIEISQVQVTEERRNRFLLGIAQLNAAFYILRDRDRCEKYLAERARVMQIEEDWRAQADKTEASDKYRRQFDQALRDTRMVVSISSKPKATAVAASAASCSGSSLALVTCAWFPGVLRARILE